jgi:hypothetical protein
MTPDRRLIGGGLLLMILPSLLLCSFHCGSGPEALDNAPWIEDMLPRARQDAEKLEKSRQEIMWRGEERRAAVRELVAGRLTLLGAAARVRELDQADPAYPWDRFHLLTPGASDDERHCRKVIGMIEGVLSPDSTEVEPAVRRCTAELQEHIDRGTLRLPEPRAGR